MNTVYSHIANLYFKMRNLRMYENLSLENTKLSIRITIFLTIELHFPSIILLNLAPV